VSIYPLFLFGNQFNSQKVKKEKAQKTSKKRAIELTIALY